MQDAVSRVHPRTWWHIGDLAWATRSATHLELAVWVRVWEDAAGRVAGFVWPSLTGESQVFCPDGAVDDATVDEMLHVVEDCALRALAAGDVVRDVHVLVAEGEEQLREALLRRGFERDEAESFDVTRRALEGLGEPRCPPGYRLSGVDDALVDGRVEAQRAAFAPSSLTRRMYDRVRRTWPYRPELDRVVVDDSGTVVAHCTAWIDERTGCGLLEPVGTHPAHRRRGLAAACCLDALHALAAAGATTAQVSCETGSAGCHTYHSIGFVTELRADTYRKSRTA
jgi:predicted N-acetyltransferase YhbS